MTELKPLAKCHAESDARHEAEMVHRERVEAHLTNARVRAILRTQNHLLANKSTEEIEMLKRVMLSMYIAGELGDMP